MGFRTVVILHNDQTSEWEKDPMLGKKIAQAMNKIGSQKTDAEKYATSLGYGSVVECAHADLQTLAILDGYQMRPLAHTNWHEKQTNESMSLESLESLEALRRAADVLGFTLHKKPASK